MPDLTETRIQSEQLVDGALLKAYRDEVRLPNGGTSVREWLDHPGASAVVPVQADGTTLLIRQFRYPARRVFLEVPAGKLDVAGEDPAEVAVRELEEETGWRAGRFEHLASLHPCIGYSNEVIHFYLAFDLERGTQDLGEGEFVEVVSMPLAEAVEQAQAGAVLDMKSTTALLLADTYLRTHNPEIMTKKPG